MKLLLKNSKPNEKNIDVKERLIYTFYYLLLMLYMFFRINESSLFTVCAVGILFLATISSYKLNFYLLIMTIPFCSYLTITEESGACINIIYILFLLKLIYKEKGYFYAKALLPISIIIGYDILQGLITGFSVEITVVHWCIATFLIMWILNKKPIDIDYDRVIKNIALGMIIIALSVIICNWGTVITSSTRNEIVGSAGLEKNTYSAYIAIIVTSLVNMFIKNKKINLFYSTLIIVFLISTFFFMSKNFIIVFCACMLIYFFTQIKNVYVTSLLVILVVGVLIFATYNQTINVLFENWIDRFTTAKDVNDLTTGRTDIFKDYIGFILNSPSLLVFGKGFSICQPYIYETYNYSLAPHNVTLQIILAWGLLGALIFVLYLFNIIRNSYKAYHIKHVYLTSLIPLFSFIISMQSLPIFFDRMTPLLFLICMLSSIGYNEGVYKDSAVINNKISSRR